ncbi:MAG: DUF202 domain-containing protein [Mycobacteriales bacterium]
MSGGHPPRPPGPAQPVAVAPERTALAWTRTVLSYGACVLLCLRLARGSAALLVAVAAVGGLAVAALGVTARRRRRALPDGAGRGLADLEAAVVAGLTVLLAVGAGTLVLLH